MTTRAADDYDNIAQRLKELEADRQLALTGSTAEVKAPKVGEYAIGWPVHSIEDVYG